jgi:hypothetical protein
LRLASKIGTHSRVVVSKQHDNSGLFCLRILKILGNMKEIKVRKYMESWVVLGKSKSDD